MSRIAVDSLKLLMLLTTSAHHYRLAAPLLYATGVVLIGIAVAGRLWCALYIGGYKNTELVTDGPYSLTRNPLYFCSSLGFVGVGFITRTCTFPLLFAFICTVIV